jgi:hypothetical protein
MLEHAARRPTRAERLEAFAAAKARIEERGHRALGYLDAIACFVPFARRWCTASEQLADVIVMGASPPASSLPKLHQAIDALEATRRALVAASAKGQP